jgi:hypothetical protein
MDDGQYNDWCINFFRALRDGGIWGTPRSGLILQKNKNQLVCIGTIPPNDALSALDLSTVRAVEFQGIKTIFAQVGITVVMSQTIKPFRNMQHATNETKNEQT